MRKADWTDSISVLDRVTAVFDAFGEHDEGLGVSELARRANLPKSTVSRIAADLVEQRLLDRDGDRFYLGIRLFELGQTVEQPRRLRRLALPILTELRNVTGHTTNLAVLEGKDVVFLSIIRGAPSQKAVARVGGRLPAHATALGKSILAFSTLDAVQQVVARGLERRTPHTICDPVDLQRELGEIRLSGMALEREECVAGRVCVASPVLVQGGHPVAAVSVTASLSEFASERVGPAVRVAAIALAQRIDAGRPH